MTVRHGWQLFMHPLFDEQVQSLVPAVTKERAKSPLTFQSGANAKVLAAIEHLIFEAIPQDPTRPDYRQGNSLGPTHRHWFRAKFGNGRFRLFFRYNLANKIIIYAWVIDQSTLRTDGSKTDAYAVFKTMLSNGNPPDSWTTLMAAARELLTRAETARP